MAITGGEVLNSLTVFDGSDVSIAGGFLNASLTAYEGSRMTLTGGAVRGELEAYRGSQVTIAGGEFDGEFRAWAGSVVNILGTEFSLDGAEINGLIPGESLIIEARDLELAGVLSDGSPFRFDLNSTHSDGNDLFDPGAVLTVTLLVPEPAAHRLAYLAIVLAAAVFGRDRSSSLIAARDRIRSARSVR